MSIAHPLCAAYKNRLLMYTYAQCEYANHDLALSGERGGSVVECRTPEREVGGSKPTAAVLCP